MASWDNEGTKCWCWYFKFSFHFITSQKMNDKMYALKLVLTWLVLFCFVLFFFSRFPILDKDWGNDVVSWYNAVVTIAKSNFVLQTLV